MTSSIKRSLFKTVCMLMVLAMMLSACTTPSKAPEPAQNENTNTSSGSAVEPATVLDTSPVKEVPDGKGLRIALAMGAVNSDFNVATHDGVVEALKKAGAEIIDSNAAGDVTRHIANIENAISSGVDAIIIGSANASEMAAVIEKAKAKNIPVISMDCSLPGASAEITSDNYALGAQMARYMINSMGGKGKVVSMYAPGYRPIEIRREVLDYVLRDYPEVEINTEVPYIWPDTIADAKTKMETILRANPEPGSINAVWVPFDLVGVGAAQAIMEAGRGDEIVIVGADGEAVAIEMLNQKGSPFIATFAQDTVEMGRQSAIAAIQAAKGTPHSNLILIPTLLKASEARAAKNTDPIQNVPSAKGLKVALAMGAVNSDFNVATHDGVIEALTEAGAEIIDTNAAGDVTRHVANIENAIASGADAIIIGSANASEMAAVVKKAAAANIPVISMDCSIGDAAAEITSDNHLMGINMARYMLSAIGGSGKIVSMYAPGYRPIEVRREMLEEVLKDYPNVEIITEVPYIWPDTIADAKSKMETILRANPGPGSIKAVWVPFDLVGVGAAQAIMEAGRGDEIVIVGADGEQVAYEMIKQNGSPFAATFAQDTREMGRQSAIAAILAAQKKLNTDTILIPTLLVTKDNVK